MSLPLPGCWNLPPPPRSMSPRISEKSNDSAWPPPGGKPPPPNGPAPWNPPANPPLRIASYSSRFFLSLRTSWASFASLKRASAALSPGFTSGWYFFASRRNAFRISSVEAPSGTPKIR